MTGGVVLAAEPTASATTNPNGAFEVVVSPPSQGIEVNPGEIVTKELRVQNQGISNESIEVSLMKFTAEGESGLPRLADMEPADDFAKWVTFSSKSFSLAPNEWKTETVKFAPPKNAAFGYYYAIVFSRAGANKQIQKNKSNFLGAVASLVLVDVKSPSAVRQVKVAEFSTKRKTFEFLPIDFNIRLHNTGNVHVASRGSITISKGGDQIAVLPVNKNNGYILPSSFRDFKVSWDDGKPIYVAKKEPDGQTTQKLEWDKFSASKLRMGKYSARLVMIYDDGKGDISTEARMSFWVMPWRIIAAVIGAGLFILAGIWAVFIRPFVGRRSSRSRSYGYRR